MLTGVPLPEIEGEAGLWYNSLSAVGSKWYRSTATDSNPINKNQNSITEARD